MNQAINATQHGALAQGQIDQFTVEALENHMYESWSVQFGWAPAEASKFKAGTAYRLRMIEDEYYYLEAVSVPGFWVFISDGKGETLTGYKKLVDDTGGVNEDPDTVLILSDEHLITVLRPATDEEKELLPVVVEEPEPEEKPELVPTSTTKLLWHSLNGEQPDNALVQDVEVYRIAGGWVEYDKVIWELGTLFRYNLRGTE